MYPEIDDITGHFSHDAKGAGFSVFYSGADRGGALEWSAFRRDDEHDLTRNASFAILPDWRSAMKTATLTAKPVDIEGRIAISREDAYAERVVFSEKKVPLGDFLADRLQDALDELFNAVSSMSEKLLPEITPETAVPKDGANAFRIK